MEKLNKNELVDIISEKTFVSKRDARAVIEATFDEIEQALLSGKEVNITNFGTLVPIQRKSRIGTDPKTHQKIVLKEKNSIAFRPSKTLKAKL